jgi:hypothetical protein
MLNVLVIFNMMNYDIFIFTLLFSPQTSKNLSKNLSKGFVSLTYRFPKTYIVTLVF